MEKIENEDMADASMRFLSAKFGDMKCKYHCYKDQTNIGGDLKEILDEFQMIIEAKELVEAQNPRTNHFTLIDKSKGIIIGSYEKSFLNDAYIKRKNDSNKPKD